MSLRTFAFFIPVLFTVAGIVYLANQPGGRLIPFAIGFLLLALLFAYYGFVSKERNPLRYRLQSGAVIMFMLAMLMAYLSNVEQNGAETINEWITPYPAIDEITFLPKTSKDLIWHWMADSPDAPDDVIAFYSDESNTEGWVASKPAGIMIFKRDNVKLTISIGQYKNGSRIYYSLVNK